MIPFFFFLNLVIVKGGGWGGGKAESKSINDLEEVIKRRGAYFINHFIKVFSENQQQNEKKNQQYRNEKLQYFRGGYSISSKGLIVKCSITTSFNQKKFSGNNFKFLENFQAYVKNRWSIF